MNKELAATCMLMTFFGGVLLFGLGWAGLVWATATAGAAHDRYWAVLGGRDGRSRTSVTGLGWADMTAGVAHDRYWAGLG